MDESELRKIKKALAAMTPERRAEELATLERLERELLRIAFHASRLAAAGELILESEISTKH